MLTWRWIGTRSNGFGRSIVSQTTVSVMRKGTFRGDHSSSNSTSIIRRGWCQVRYPCLRMRVMMSGRIDRMVMPRCRIWRVIAPALRKALVAGWHGWIGGTGSTRGRPTGRRRRRRRTGRVVGFIIRGRTGSTSRSSSSSRGRPKAKSSPGLPVVPGGTGGRGGIGRQIVIRRGIVTPVSLMMVQRFARRGRIMRVLGMVRTVTPAALRPRGGRMGVTYHARRARTTWCTWGFHASDFSVSGTTASRCRR